MTLTMDRTPENILLATLHKVGPDVRLVDNHDFAELFNIAAKSYRDVFKSFAWHRHYHVSERLCEALQALDHAGSIIRENAAQTYFRVSAHAAGPFGASVFDSLAAQERLAVEELATKIRDRFRGQNEPGKRD